MKSSKNKDAFELLNKEGTINAVYDTETGGLNALLNPMYQLVAIKNKVENGKWVEIDRLDIYMQPDDGLVWSPEAAALGVESIGLNPDGKLISPVELMEKFLSDKPTEAEVFERIYEFFKDVDIICGHNVLTFDHKFMRMLYARNGHIGEFTFDEKNTADTLSASRDIVPKEKAVDGRYRLANMAEYYGITEEGKFHNAMTDVLVCQQLAQKLCGEYDEWDDVEKEWSDPNLVPEVRFVSLFIKNYKTVNFLYITLQDGSKYRFNRARLSWDIVERKSPYSLENVITAVYKYTGCENDKDLSFWKPQRVQA